MLFQGVIPFPRGCGGGIEPNIESKNSMILDAKITENFPLGRKDGKTTLAQKHHGDNKNNDNNKSIKHNRK